MRIDSITIESDAFAQMRVDANMFLQKTFESMINKNCESAEVTIKMSIDLIEDHVKDSSAENGTGFREITVPTIKHKVTAVMQIKGERKGQIGGLGFELDIVDGKYVIRPTGAKQTSMFENEDDGASKENAINVDFQLFDDHFGGYLTGVYN